VSWYFFCQDRLPDFESLRARDSSTRRKISAKPISAVYPDAGESARIRAHLTEFHLHSRLRDLHHSLVKRAQATITPKARCSTPQENSSITAESTIGTKTLGALARRHHP
jgi:hypothetical protein